MNNKIIISSLLILLLFFVSGCSFSLNDRELSSAGEDRQVDDNQELGVYIEDDVVYYVDEQGEKEIIAKSNRAEDLMSKIYKFAQLSPNKKFIALGSTGWEVVNLEVYVIETEEIHTANETGHDFAEWLPDSRLKVFGGCGMGVSCGIFESVSAEKPWNLELVEEVDPNY